MKREGYVIKDIVEYSNIEESFRKVLRGKVRKSTKSGKFLMNNKEVIIYELISSISDGSFRIGNFYEKEIHEGGKLRRIQVISLKDRIGAHAVMNIVDQRIHNRFIRTTSASIKNRGTHDLLSYIRRDISTDPTGTMYCYKFDISKFYESIDHDILISCVKRIFKDKVLIKILEGFIRMMPSGISIGLRSSQGLGNLLLSVYLDHNIKDKYGIKYYYRYCDDGIILSDSKKELWRIRKLIHNHVSSIGLKIKENDRIFPISEGIDFLGYVINPEFTRLRKRVKKNFARKLNCLKSRRRRRELISSFYGMVKHADCNNLFIKLTGNKMRDFKSLNISYKPEDGKKRFGGTIVSIRELVNLEITVLDFETGIKTEQGDDRCIVSIKMNGDHKKFFTNSEEMKNILQQISSVDGFPFNTTIKTETFGKSRTKYIFT